MRTTRRYPAEAISRLNLAVESAPTEDGRPPVDLELIATPGRLIFLGIVFGLLGLLITVQLLRLQLSEKMGSIVPPDPDVAYHIFFPRAARSTTAGAACWRATNWSTRSGPMWSMSIARKRLPLPWLR